VKHSFKLYNGVTVRLLGNIPTCITDIPGELSQREKTEYILLAKLHYGLDYRPDKNVLNEEEIEENIERHDWPANQQYYTKVILPPD
jgi:hypothetical protein